MRLAGKNRILAPNEILFKTGDQSDGMFVVRKGQLLIYLDKGDDEIPLATVSEGAMVGEMALFDKKPRSASARAIDQVEVTEISNADFARIMKQIPKWFVSLMSTLSMRLRDTNHRLEEMEAQYKGNINPIDELRKILHITDLLWSKIGNKEGKLWSMDRLAAEADLAEILAQPIEKIKETTQVFVECGLLTPDKDSYNKETFTIKNRGSITRLTSFISRFRKQDNALKEFPSQICDMLDIMRRIAESSGYQTVTINQQDLVLEAQKLSLNPTTWDQYYHILDGLTDSIEVVQLPKSQLGFKVCLKKIPRAIDESKMLLAITNKRNKGKKASPKS